jgi:hypothetical protein
MLRTPFTLLCALVALAFAAPAAHAQAPPDATAPVDTTALPTPDGGGWYAHDPVTVTLTATDDSSGVDSFAYTIDGGAEQTAAAGTQVTIAGDGSHTFTHRVRDAAGNWSDWVVDVVAIDATAPADGTTVPAGWSTSAPVAVTLTGSDGGSGVDSFEYRLDGGTPQTAADGGTVLVSGEGVHLLAHRARDVAGTFSSWTTDTIRIDTVAPANTTGTVDGAWRSADASIAVLGADATSGVDHVEWRVDGASPAHTGPSGSTATVAGDGTHLLETRVVDAAGLAGSWRTDTVRIDTVAPSDTTAVSAGWRPGPVTVQVAGGDAVSGVARVEWQLDGGTVQSSTTVPQPVVVSAEGEHTLRTRAIDGAGNASAWTDRAVRIDGTAPTNLTPVADPAWRAADYAVGLGAADSGAGLDHMEYRVDGGVVRTAPAGTTVQVTGTGGHLLETRAVDLAGNASPWRGDAVNIDQVAPADTSAAIPTAAQPNPYRLTLTGTDAHSGVDHVEWEIDGGGVHTGPGGTEVAVSGGGRHTLRERVVDAAGNASGWRSGTVTIDPTLNGDTTAPTDDSTAVPAGWQTRAVDVTMAGSDADSGLDHMEWRLDGRPLASGPGGTVVTVTGDGVHHLETRAVDFAGNASSWRAQVIRIDTTVPVDTTSVPAGWTSSPTVAVAGTDAASGVASVEWSLDGAATQSGPSGSVVTVSGDGVHTLAHRVLDAAGQASPWTDSTVRLDTVAPVDTTPGLPTGWQPAAITRTPSGTDERSGLARMEWRLDGGDVLTGPIEVDADGTHTVETRAIDAAGNASDWRASTVQVDVTAPENTTPRPGAGWLAEPYRATVSADDGAGSGVERVEWKVGSGAVATTSDAVVDADGGSTLYTRAVDAVGHASAWRADTVRVDRGAPALALDCGGDAWRASPASCAVSGDGGPSGLASLTVARGSETPRAVASGGTVTVDADGVWTVAATAVDGAGNRAALARTVRVDRTPPSAAVRCAGHRCTAVAADAGSGLARVLWRVDGGDWRPVGGDFDVASGRVEVRATDRVGLVTTSAPVTVAAAATPSAPGAKPARVRHRSVPVSLRHSKGADGLIGSLELSIQRAAGGRTLATIDVRPLAVGRGRFRTTVSLHSGDLVARRRRTVKVGRDGHTPRLAVALSKVRRRTTAVLTVERRRGRHWVRIARATAVAKPPR